MIVYDLRVATTLNLCEENHDYLNIPMREGFNSCDDKQKMIYSVVSRCSDVTFLLYVYNYTEHIRMQLRTNTQNIENTHTAHSYGILAGFGRKE